MILIIGLLLIIISLFLITNDGEAEDFLNPFGAVLFIVSIIIMIWGIVDLCADDKPAQPVAAEVLQGDTLPQVKPDSIYGLQFVISWKDENGVGAGGVKFLGHTEKSVGDTLTIQLK
jgi:hypothetical protein